MCPIAPPKAKGKKPVPAAKKKTKPAAKPAARAPAKKKRALEKGKAREVVDDDSDAVEDGSPPKKRRAQELKKDGKKASPTAPAATSSSSRRPTRGADPPSDEPEVTQVIHRPFDPPCARCTINGIPNSCVPNITARGKSVICAPCATQSQGCSFSSRSQKKAAEKTSVGPGSAASSGISKLGKMSFPRRLQLSAYQALRKRAEPEWPIKHRWVRGVPQLCRHPPYINELRVESDISWYGPDFVLFPYILMICTGFRFPAVSSKIWHTFITTSYLYS